MMNKLLIRSIALLLIAVMMLGMVGCAAVTQQLDSIFRKETTAPQDDIQAEPEIEMPARAKETYTILLLTEAVENGRLDNLMLISFNTATPELSILQLPTDLYLHIAEFSAEGLFKQRYEASIADGHTEKDSVATAAEAVVEVLSSGFNTPIDYYINFTGAQLSALVNTLGGIKMAVPFTMGSLSTGTQTLSGSQVLEFLAYEQYSDMPQTYMDARKLLTAAISSRVRDAVETEMLSLFVLELRSEMVTNIPSEGGEDIFFVRKWLQTAPTAFRIANISTQLVYINSTACRVLIEGNTLTQMNELLGLYDGELNDEQFDPKYVFVDYSSDVAKAVYNSSAVLPSSYTARQLLDGALVLRK